MRASVFQTHRLLVALILLPAWGAASRATAGPTTLAIDGSRFTLNGRPTFLLGCSYYSALGASRDTMRRDFADLERHGFNWIRVWATWGAYGNRVSAVDETGKGREPYLGRLKWLVAECDRRGMVVDVTLARDAAWRGPGPNPLLPDLAAHRAAVATLVGALKAHRNWYLDLANERDVHDGRFVPIAELRVLAREVHELDPGRLVTASGGGNDPDAKDIEALLTDAGLDFIAPHRPREPGSPAQTAEKTRALLAAMRRAGRVAPILYQEPFRRGYGAWQPTADDFLQDLRGAREGGAAGWCFHNGGSRGAPDERPRKSFDLRDGPLFGQLDAEEKRFLSLPK